MQDIKHNISSYLAIENVSKLEISKQFKIWLKAYYKQI